MVLNHMLMDNNNDNQNQESNWSTNDPQFSSSDINGTQATGGTGGPQKPKKKNNVVKLAVTAVAGVVIGGGLVYGSFSLGENSSAVNSNNAGTTEVSKVKVSTDSQITKAFNKTKNTVVSVVNLQKQSDSLDGWESMFGGSSSSGNSSSSSSSSKSLEEYSEGSGLIYKKADGKAYIVTNNHVVSGSDKVEVILNSGKKLTATMVGTDEVTDLAVLTIDGSDITSTATFGDSSSIKVGEPAIAIGSPLGSEYATSVTSGIISAKSRTVAVTDEDTGETTGEQTVIQTDAAINPGNSGGPLINVEGQVIGINSMKLSGSDIEGMGFAIPSNEVVSIINQLVKNGKVIRPALGISSINLSDVTSTQQESVLKLPSSVTTGVVIASVTDSSPAGKGGLKKYDVITALDDTAVTDHATLQTTLYKHAVGDKVKVTYYRDGKKATTTLTLTATTDILTNTTDSSSSSSNSNSNSGTTGGSSDSDNGSSFFGGE